MRLLLNPFTRNVDALPHWRDLAACDGGDLEIFFPTSVTGPAVRQISQAKAICENCSVYAQCLEYALNTGQDYGVWGGLTPKERRYLRQRNARGA